MQACIDQLIDVINKKGIKVVTISEPNHRSYTSHTFNYEFMKCILQRTDINTLSSEKLGVFDAMMMNYYLKKKRENGRCPQLPSDIEKIHKFSGLGTKRWLNYLKKCRHERYNFVGAEFNPYNPYKYDREALREFFSPEFVESILDPAEGGGEIVAITENDKLARDSFDCMKDFYKNRESFWMLNIKRILEEHDNLFIVGFHLERGEPIGNMIKKMYPDTSLFIGSCALFIKTQILIVDDSKGGPTAFNKALENGDYREVVEEIDEWAPPTPYELKMDKKADQGWGLVKVDKRNNKGRIRGIGCFIAMNESEYKSGKKMTDIFTPVKSFDYILFMRHSEYEENMFI